jgi:peptidoglycan/xylan/chitin deacetylase (PgdA/CDA1 family)
MRPSRVLRHPLVVIPLVAAVMTMGWLRYTQGQESVSRADPGAELFGTAVEAVGNAATRGWRVDHSLDASVSLTAGSGSVGDLALEVDVSRYVSGDVTLTSPRIAVTPQQNYLFKTYYSSGPAFTLLAHYFYLDGTDSLVALRDYPAHPRARSTVSAAFSSGDTVSAVQYVFRLASVGTLQIDGPYLQPAQDVYVPEPPPSSPNLIPNPSLDADRSGMPAQWSFYQSGWANGEYLVQSDSRGKYLETQIRDYQGGEAKWQYPPIPVQADQHYRFAATYRSDQQVDVVAEFELKGGGRQFLNLSTVPPAGDWTTLTEEVQVPAGATSLMLTLVSHGNGTTAVRDYELVDVTRPGDARWNRPLVSITFDDGWQSAYDQAVPLMQKYGYTGTFYVNPATIETRHFLTASELQSLHRTGNDIAVHGYEDGDLTLLSADRIDYQLATGRDALAEAGLEPIDLATPVGRSDAQVEWYARKYFQTVRGMEAGINTRQNLDPYDLKVFSVDSHTTPEAFAGALTEARESGGWLILVYHQISSQPDGSDRATITKNVFASQLEMIGGSGIAVEPVSRAFAEVRAN